MQSLSAETPLTSMLISRATFDVDLLVREQNAESWLAFFQARGYAIARRTSNFIRLRFAADPSGALPIDLMLVSEETFRKIESESLRCEVGSGLTLAIPSALHLIAMKLHALHNAQRVERGTDLQDVRHLIKTARIDISCPAFTAILDRYATNEIRRLIQSEFGK